MIDGKNCASFNCLSGGFMLVSLRRKVLRKVLRLYGAVTTYSKYFCSAIFLSMVPLSVPSSLAFFQ